MPLFGSCWNCSRFLYFFFFCSLLLVRLSGCSLQPLLSGFIIIKRKASGNGTLWFACKFSHWIFPIDRAARPRRHSHLCVPERSAALGMAKMVSVQSTLGWWMYCPSAQGRLRSSAVLFVSHVVTNSAILVVDLLLQYDPNVCTTPCTPRTHPKVMKYPLPGRAEPLKMPAEWENTHCLVQGRFLWGEALTSLNEPTLKAARKNKCPSTLRKSDLEEICIYTKWDVTILVFIHII